MAAEFRSSRFDQGSSKMVKVIIQYKQPVSNSQEVPGERDLKNQGAMLHTRFSSIRATVMSVPAWMIPQIAKNPNVAYITPDRPVQMTSNDEDMIAATTRDVAATQFGFDGTGVGVAVIDSGVADHPDLHNANGASRVVYSESFVTGDSTTGDKYGHGTHVAGIIGGNGASSGVYAILHGGMAAGVNIINLRVLGTNGSGSTAAFLNAMNWILSPADPTKAVSSSNPLNKDKYNIRVVNMSLGAPAVSTYKNDPLCRAARALVDAGVVVVAAAGNNGKDANGNKLYGQIHSPGNEPSVITVGAANTFGTNGRNDDGVGARDIEGEAVG